MLTLGETPLLAIAAAVGTGIFVQSAVGFGAGLFAVPLLVWAGLELPVAIATTLTVVFFQTGFQSWLYRNQMPKGAIGRMLVPRLVGAPLGILVLGLLDARDEDRLQMLLGVFLLVVVLVQAGVRVTPRERIAGYWTPIVGLLSGFLAGLFGMGGPPLVLFVLAHDWPPGRSRSFLWGSFFVLAGPQLGLMAWRFGTPVLEGMQAGVLMLPVLLLGSHVGERVGRRLSRTLLRRLAFALLVALALRTLWSAA